MLLSTHLLPNSSRPFKEKNDIIHRLEENTDHRSEWEKFMDSIGLGSQKPKEEPPDTATVDEENSDDEDEEGVYFWMYSFDQLILVLVTNTYLFLHSLVYI